MNLKCCSFYTSGVLGNYEVRASSLDGDRMECLDLLPPNRGRVSTGQDEVGKTWAREVITLLSRHSYCSKTLRNHIGSPEHLPVSLSTTRAKSRCTLLSLSTPITTFTSHWSLHTSDKGGVCLPLKFKSLIERLFTGSQTDKEYKGTSANSRSCALGFRKALWYAHRLPLAP